MALYRVQSNGKAPVGLSAGDEVVTGGGTYRIVGVNADGSYRSVLSNQSQTIRNYQGSYAVPEQRAAQAKTAPTFSSERYTPSGETEQARAELARVQSEKPGGYVSGWDKELDALYDQIASRGAFSYDLGTDPVYRQYREQYQSAGRMAMEDTMGRAAALTGGYGSSYGQQAGQQAYNAYLQKLNEAVPELYAQAREQYDREGSALYDRYDLVRSRDVSDYARYRDRVSDYYAALSDARSAYDTAARPGLPGAIRTVSRARCRRRSWQTTITGTSWSMRPTVPTQRMRSTGSSWRMRTNRPQRRKRRRRRLHPGKSRPRPD